MFSGAEPLVQHEEQFCEIILDLDHRFKRCRLNIFSSSTLTALIQQIGTICESLVEGIIGNNSAKLIRIWISGSEDVYKISYLELWWPERNPAA